MNWPKKVTPADVPFGFAIAAPSNMVCARSASCSFVCWLSGGSVSALSVDSATGNIRPKLDGTCTASARRRTQASIAHIAGDSTGFNGLVDANGLSPSDVKTFDTTSVTTLGGADTLAIRCVSGAPATAEASPDTE